MRFDIIYLNYFLPVGIVELDLVSHVGPWME